MPAALCSHLLEACGSLAESCHAIGCPTSHFVSLIFLSQLPFSQCLLDYFSFFYFQLLYNLLYGFFEQLFVTSGLIFFQPVSVTWLHSWRLRNMWTSLFVTFCLLLVRLPLPHPYLLLLEPQPFSPFSLLFRFRSYQLYFHPDMVILHFFGYLYVARKFATLSSLSDKIKRMNIL